MPSMAGFAVAGHEREGLVTEPFRYMPSPLRASQVYAESRGRSTVQLARHLRPIFRKTVRTTRSTRRAAVPFMTLFMAAVSVWSAPPAAAQEDFRKGMVWTAPTGEARAERDLHEMKASGVAAIRTAQVPTESVLRLADSLELNLYLDLPITRLPAARLLDTLRYARSALDTLVALAHGHASIRAIGLAHDSDTSDPASCTYLEELVRRIRESGPPGMATYYVSRFIEADACASAVDFVLADLRDAPGPARVLQRWQAAGHGSPLGVASLGIWVRSDTLRGLNVPASPERQARYFEDHLTHLLSDTLSVRPAAVFVYRWRDLRRAYASTAHDLVRPYEVRYGLHTAEGIPRPARRVVAGIFAGQQNAFAFDRGDAPPTANPWPTLLGWGILATIGVFYALSPRFRHLVPRYFSARFFFREAVREGRDVLLGASTVLLATIGASSGLVAFVLVDAIRATYAFSLVMRWLPVPAQDVVATMLAQPFVLIALVGCINVTMLLVWSVMLSILTRRTYSIAPAQVLMLVVWPRWPLLLVMVAAIVAASLPEPDVRLMGALASGWVLVSLAAVVRTLIDLMAVARLSVWVIPPAVLLHPAAIAAGALAVVLLGYTPELEFVWHAAVRR